MVETLIYMAVSTAIFASSAAIVGDHQARTDFNYGIQELSSQLRAIINDVSTGYYENRGNVSCNNPGGGSKPNINPGTDAQGSSNDCIFVGRILHFRPDSASSGIGTDQVYRVYTAVGVRTAGDGDQDVERIEDSEPTIIRNSDVAGMVQEYTIPNGIQLRSARNTGTGSKAYAIGLFTNFAKYADLNQNSFETNARNVGLIPFNISESAGENAVETQVAGVTSLDYDNGNGMELCLEARGYRGTIIIGGNNSNLGEDLLIERGSCPFSD